LDAVGAGLTGYAALMTRIAGRGVTRRAARLFAALDVAWVLGTVAVVAAFWSWFGRPGALERARDVDRGRRFRRGAVPRGGILRDA